MTTLTLLLSFSCVRFDDGGGSTNNSSSDGSDGTALDKTFDANENKVLKQQVKAKMKALPTHFVPGINADFEFVNANNSDLNDIHLIITDDTGNTYYSGSARGLKWQTKKRPLKLGGSEEILVIQTHGREESQIRYRVKDGNLKIVLF